MKIRFIAFFIAILAFALPSVAQAAAITPAGAIVLKKSLEDAIGWRLKAMQLGGDGIISEGEVKVTPKEDFYAVSLPRLGMKFSDGKTLNFGVININAKPGKTEDEWMLSIAVPTPLTLLDAQSQPVMSFSIGKQRFSGRWLPKSDFFSAVDAAYEDIKFETTKKDIEGTISSVHTTLDLKQEDSGMWSGSNNFDIKNILFKTIGDQQASIKLESVSSKAQYTEIDVKGSQELSRKLQETSSEGKTPDAEETKDLIRNSASFFKRFASDISNTMTLANLDIVAQNKESEPLTLHIGNMSFMFSATGINNETADITLNGGVKGFAISALPEKYADITPQSLSSSVVVNNLPLQSIVSSLAQAALGGSSQNPEQTQKDVAGLVSLPDTLTAAKTAINVKESTFKSPALETRFTGAAKADSLAVYKATAGFDLVFTGLDALMQKYAGEMDTNGTATNSSRDLIMFLTPLQMMGQQETAPNGATSRKYHFELTQDGKMLINGADMAMLKSMFESSLALQSKTEPQNPPQEKKL